MQILTFLLENRQKSPVKHFIDKPILIDFVNFSTVFRLRLFFGLLLTKRYRRSRSEVFCKKDVLRNIAKFTGKHLCQRFFFNKVAGLWHRCFPVNLAKFLTTSFFTEHLRWQLLKIILSINLILSQLTVTHRNLY